MPIDGYNIVQVDRKEEAQATAGAAVAIEKEKTKRLVIALAVATLGLFTCFGCFLWLAFNPPPM